MEGVLGIGRRGTRDGVGVVLRIVGPGCDEEGVGREGEEVVGWGDLATGLSFRVGIERVGAGMERVGRDGIVLVFNWGVGAIDRFGISGRVFEEERCSGTSFDLETG